MEQYQHTNYFQRMMASMNVSVATIQAESNDRRVGAALKLNLYKQADPMLINKMHKELEKPFDEAIAELTAEEKS